MGIDNFGVYIKKDFSGCMTTNKPEKLSSLFIDANGIFYKATGTLIPMDITDKEKDKLLAMGKDKIEDKIVKLCIERLNDIITQFRPTDNLIVAIDGMANAAKMNQQKFRRYGKSSETDNIFSTKSFTPGTEIMMRIDEAFEKYIKTIKDVKNVIYSSHLVTGEAEHKIFDFIRANKLVIEDEKSEHILFGEDSDLLVLSILSPLNNMYVYRENTGFFYDINKFKKLVEEKLKRPNANKEIIYQDFALITYFIGNDFLPRMPNLPSIPDTMRLMIKIYNKIDKDMTTSEGKVIWYNFVNLFNCLDKWKRNDYNMYINNFIRPLKYPLKILHKNIILTDVTKRKVKEVYDPSKHFVDFDLKSFANDWYNSEFEPKDKKLKELYNGDDYFTSRDIAKMVIKYLQTFQWVLQYYLNGPKKVTNGFFYPYRHTPLSLSIVNYLRTIIRNKQTHYLDNIMKEKNYPINVAHQLMLVIPPSHIDLIPKAYHEVYKTDLACISPLEYKIKEPESTDLAHNTKPDIPPINFLLAINASRKIKLSDRYKEKKNLFISNKLEEKPKETLIPIDGYTVNKKVVMM